MKTIELSGDIGFEITAEKIRAQLDMNSGETVLIKITSYGGDVWEAFKIYNLFKDYPGTIKIRPNAIAMSAAAYCVLGADEIELYKNSVLMFHRAWCVTWGNAVQLASDAKILSDIDEIGAEDYANRTGKTRTQALDEFTNEVWLIGAEKVAAAGIPFTLINEDSENLDSNNNTEASAREKMAAVMSRMKDSSPKNHRIDMSILNKYQPKPQEGTMKQSFQDFMKDNPDARAEVIAYAAKENPPAGPATPPAPAASADEGNRTAEILALAGVKISAEVTAALADPAMTPEKFAYDVLKKNVSALAASNASTLGAPAATAQTPSAQSTTLADNKKGPQDAVTDPDEIRKLAKKNNGGK